MARKKASSAERLAKLREKLGKTDMGGGGGGGFFYPQEGRSTIRILPETGDMEFFFQQVGRHRFSNEKDSKQVYCPNYTSEGELDCPICEARNVLYKQGKTGDKGAEEMSKQLSVRRTFWMNVIDRADEDAGPKIFTPGVTIFSAIAHLITDPDYGDVTDVLDGTDITIEREGTGLATEYNVVPKRQITPLHESDDQIEEWLDAARDVSFVEVSEDAAEDSKLSKGHAIYVLPYERVQAEFDDYFGLNDDDEEEEEPVVKKKAPARKRRTTKAKPVVEEVEEEDNEEDDSVEKELEERKTRRVRRRRVRK